MSLIESNIELYKDKSNHLFVIEHSKEQEYELWSNLTYHLQYLSDMERLPTTHPELDWEELIHQLPPIARAELKHIISPNISVDDEELAPIFLAISASFDHRTREAIVKLFADNKLLYGGIINKPAQESNGVILPVLAISTNFDSYFDGISNDEFLEMITDAYTKPGYIVFSVQLKDGNLDYNLADEFHIYYTDDVQKDIIEANNLTPVNYKINIELLD